MGGIHKIYKFLFLFATLLLSYNYTFSQRLSSNLPGENVENFNILKLRILESQNPGSAKVKCDLGIAFFKSRQISRAIDKLEQSYQIVSYHPLTLFFLSLAFQKTNSYFNAEKYYRECARLDVPLPVKTELTLRISDLKQKRIEQKISQRLNRNATVAHTPQPNSLAVLYFRNLSKWQELDPVINGLVKLIEIDLRQISLLQVTPCKHLDILLAVKKYGPSEIYDKLTMQQLGRILDTQYLITGGLERVSETHIRLSAGVIYAQTGKLVGNGSKVEGSVSNLPGLEKQLVFDLIKDMQVRLDKSVTEKIKQHATNSNLAFIAFCKGVYYTKQKLFIRANQQFQEALQYDSHFELARQQMANLQVKRLTNEQMERLLLK